MRKVYLLILSICYFVGVNAQTALPTVWDFDSPAITSPPVGWIYSLDLETLASNNTYGNAGIPSGGNAARLDFTGEFITIFFADKPGPLSYYIKGATANNAPFQGTFDVQESTNGLNWTSIRTLTSLTVAQPGTKFIDQPLATSRYIRFFFTNKVSGSNVQLDSVYLNTPPPPTIGTINAKLGTSTTSIINNSVVVLGTSSSVNFKIENIGTIDALTINSINISGPAASDFQLNPIPSIINAVSNQILTVNFSTTATGSRFAVLTINSNDVSKSPYTMTLLGIGGAFASEPISAPASLTISSPKAYGFKVAITAPVSKPDKYIILRKMGSSISEVPLDGKTYKRGDAIGGSVVAYVGDTIVTNYQPTYIFANTQYTFSAFSFNGPAGFENYLTTANASNSVTTLGKQIGNYYNGIDPNNTTTFVSQLTAKIYPHTSIFYGSYAASLMTAFVARDTTGGKFVANCVYTNLPYIYDGVFLWKSGSNGANLSREHSFPQSWMQSILGNPSTWPDNAAGNEYQQYNDMHHLFPADQDLANAIRSNYTFGNVVTTTNTSPTGKGKLGKDASGTKTVYEPRDEHKGAAARAIMYMSVCYNTSTASWAIPKNAITGRGDQDTAVLMQWHRQYPPSNFEIARHEFIYGLQNNRNPFIDNPEWASKINFVNMTHIGLGTGTTPGTTTTPGTSTSTGFIDNQFGNSINIYPNPASESIVIDASAIFSDVISYDILDTKGVSMLKGELKSPISTVNLPLNDGIYFLMLQTERGKAIRKISKK